MLETFGFEREHGCACLSAIGQDFPAQGVITGQYGYKTTGGQNILVKYSAGADTGFVIENMDELQAALESSAAEAVAVKAKPYTGETVEIEYVGPNAEAQDASYKYGYKASDKTAAQAADASGNVEGSFSFKT